MNRLFLALLLCVSSTAVQAGDSKHGLWRCGLKFGDSPKAGSAYIATKAARALDGNQVVRSIEVVRPELHSFTSTTSQRTIRRRIPPTFTLAKLVCSW